MNLWVKRTGQLFLAALFLIACEDETYLLGFRDQKGKFNIGYREFIIGDLTYGTVRADSMVTDNLTGTQRLLAGEYFDPVTGTVRAESFTEFLPTSTAKLAQSTSRQYIYDSLLIQFRLDGYSYGLESEDVFKMKVHRITEDTLSYKQPHTYSNNGKDTTEFLTKRYLASSTIGYDPVELAEASLYRFSVLEGKHRYTPTSLKLSKLEEAKDTLLVRCVLPETDAFGQELFNVALHDDNSEFSSNKKFRSRFKGLALIPTQGDAIIGLRNNLSLLSKVTLYYHSTEAGVNVDTLARDFSFSGVSFNSFTPTRSSGLPSADEPFTGVLTGDLGVVQSGSPLMTRIDLNAFYEQFADTIKSDQKIVINSAELVVESVPSVDGYKPIPNFEMRILKEDDGYADRRTQDSIFITPYTMMTGGSHPVMTDGRGYYVGADLSQTAAYLFYNKSKQSYSGFPTLFIQSLLDNRNKEGARLRYVGLFPATSLTGISNVTSPGKYVHRTVFSRSSVKLRIYYTYPNKTNL